MKFLKLFIIILLINFIQKQVYSQVEFKIERIGDDEYYKVSLISEKTYQNPLNITSTAQVTLKVPSDTKGLGGFIPSNPESLQPGLKWVINGRTNSPKEAPGYDYIYFGLSTLGTSTIKYEEGAETPLFLFYNAGNCVGNVYLMDNAKDPFVAPNSENVNVGNQITILGAGGNAWKGNIGEGYAECSENVLPRDPQDGLIVTPNPAVDVLWADFKSESDEDVPYSYFLRDLASRTLIAGKGTGKFGLNRIELDISHLPSGSYVFEIHRKGKRVISERVVKSGL